MKKITKKIIAGALAVVATLGTGAISGGLKVKANETADVISVVSPAPKSLVAADNESIAEFFSNYEPNYSKEFFGRGEILPMNEIKLEWTCEDGKYYIVYIDSAADFSSAEKFVTVKPEISIGNLIPNVNYFWKVKVVKDSEEQVFSRVYTFKMQAYVRSVTIDGVSNVRDLGGYATADGKTIKYGMLYRSAKLEGVTEKGKMQAKRLGIKTDLDLRGEESTVSPLGEGVKRINYNAPWYVNEVGAGKSYGIDGDAEYVDAFVNEIKTCANPENYPMLFHCAIGRDRTGTLAAMLLAICGVEKQDIIREYELSWFSEAACDNPDIQISKINKLCDFIETKRGANFKEKAMWCLMSIGVSRAEIDSIRNILVG